MTEPERGIEEWRDEFTRYYGALLNKPVCCGMGNNDCGCDGRTYLNEITGFIDELLHQELQKAREEERERVVKTIRRKTLEWSSQYHLQNFDRTLSHQSGMAVGYSVATKDLDHLLAGIQSGAPLDQSELDQPIS